MQVETWPIGRLIPHPRNARTHSPQQVEQIAASIKAFGFVNPVLVDDRNEIIAGHGRLMGAQALGMETVPVIVLHGLTETQAAALRIADNRIAQNAGWNDELLRVELGNLKKLEFDLGVLGFEVPELTGLLDPEGVAAAAQNEATVTLAERFGAPPFSVLDARQGWWQERKRAWIALGIKSELGRGEVQGSMASARSLQTGDPARKAAPGGNALPAANYQASGGAKGDGRGRAPKANAIAAGYKQGDDGHMEGWVTSSIFDPVLCELAYRWFCPPGGRVLDPFAGGSVRGIVAGKLGRSYLGIDLRAEQVEANKAQADAMGVRGVNWVVGDSAEVNATDAPADMLFTCPPYADLEVYSDNPKDLSTMPYGQFVAAYRKIIANAAAMLADNRFAVVVVGEVRAPDGSYRGFVPDTIDAFERAGLEYYNEAILVTAVGSLPVRTGRTFEATRKLGKTHQNVLVFLKGDARKAAQACGQPDFADPISGIPGPAAAAGTTRWKVSAAWASKPHDCTLAGILKRCQGGCCKGDTFWPSKSFAEPGVPTQCGNLGASGCVWTAEEKPVTCLLYPLILNNSGTLVLHNRATTEKGVCKGNFGSGPPVIEALKDNLTELFGADQWERVRTDVLAGRDSYFDVPPAVAAAVEREREYEAAGTKPRKRNEGLTSETAETADVRKGAAQIAAIPRVTVGPEELTPIEEHGGFLVKRDDLCEVAGVAGGKVRTCWMLSQGAKGLVTAGSRASPQVNIVAHIAKHLGIPCRVHTPQGELSPEVLAAQAAGAEVVQHKAGYNSVIIKRATDDARARGWADIPFGMECAAAVTCTAAQASNVVAAWAEKRFKRLVVPVGSGMSLAGILHGLSKGLPLEPDMPILAVSVGALPHKRLKKYAPAWWAHHVQLVDTGLDYHKEAPHSMLGGLQLDPIYEAKCLPFLEPGDMLWVVGIRQTAVTP